VKTTQKPPATLPSPARKLWSKIRDEYGIEDAAGIAILTAACEAYARLIAARERLDVEGLTVLDRHKQLRAHPLVAVELASRSQLINGLKALGLDIAPLELRPGRPAGSLSRFKVV